MSSLISESTKLTYGKVFNDIHDTFSRKITIWKTPKKVVISSTPNYNFLYNSEPDLQVSYIPVSGTFDARILWGDPTKSVQEPNIKEEFKNNLCRIKVKKDVIDFLDGASQVEIDGRKVESVGSSRPHGLFNVDYYTLFFREVD